MNRVTSVSVIFPAYNEEANLALVTTVARTFLASEVADYRIIVVDDGSTDRTARVADELQAENPEHLIVVTHDVNRGYGAAVRSGIAAALQTGCEWIFLSDADGQFDIRELSRLLDIAEKQGVDVVTGHRVRRADPLVRRLNARLWNTASCLLLGLHVHDVDCAFKLVHRQVLEMISLEGQAAVISPELLAKACRAGFRIVETPVSHYPRHAGEQSGANLSVIARSLVGLVALRLSLTHPKPQTPSLSGQLPSH